MNKQKSQSGFAHLMILTVVLALIVVGLLGFVFYQNFVQKKDSAAKADDSSKTVDEKAGEDKSKTDTTDKVAPSTEGYLVLDDWGVKFKLPSNLGSDTLTYKKTSSTSYNDGYSFSTNSVEAISEYCKSTPIGWISRYVNTTNLPVNVGSFITKIDNHSYYSLMAMSDCSDGSSTVPASAYPIIHDLLLSVEKK